MSSVDTASVDAIYSSHNIEHLYPNDVGAALQEFSRLLRHDGFVMLTCPGLYSICRLVVDDKVVDTACHPPAGPIAAIDMLYGFRPSMAEGDSYTSRRSGFTETTLRGTFEHFGFLSVATLRCEKHFDLFCLASKKKLKDNELISLAKSHFP